MATRYTKLIPTRAADAYPGPPDTGLAPDPLPPALPGGDTDDPFDGDEVAAPDPTMPAGLAVMVVLLVDVSSSLVAYATKIQEAFASLFASLRKNGTTRVCVDVLVVTFADRVKTFGFAPAAKFAAPDLVFGGMTNTAEALDMAREKIEARWREYATRGVSLNKTLVFVVTDGQPTSPPEAYRQAVARLRAFEAKNRRVEVFPIAAGSPAMPALAELSGGREPLLLDQAHWDELFAWIYQSTLVVSGSIPGGRVDLPDTRGWAKTRSV